MSFYRAMLAGIAAIAIAAPVFAADDATTATTTETTATETTASSTNQAQEVTKVDINSASVSDLVKVKGLSRSKAKAIVSYREKNGKFTSLDDLANVKGFKKMKSEQMKEIQDQLTIG